MVAVAVPGPARLRAHAGDVIVSGRTHRARRAGSGHGVDRAALTVHQAHFARAARRASAARRGELDALEPGFGVLDRREGSVGFPRAPAVRLDRVGAGCDGFLQSGAHRFFPRSVHALRRRFAGGLRFAASPDGGVRAVRDGVVW